MDDASVDFESTVLRSDGAWVKHCGRMDTSVVAGAPLAPSLARPKGAMASSVSSTSVRIMYCSL